MLIVTAAVTQDKHSSHPAQSSSACKGSTLHLYLRLVNWQKSEWTEHIFCQAFLKISIIRNWVDSLFLLTVLLVWVKHRSSSVLDKFSTNEQVSSLCFFKMLRQDLAKLLNTTLILICSPHRPWICCLPASASWVV